MAVRVEDEQGIPPTAQTLSKRRTDLIEDLRRRKRIWAEHEDSALEIRSTWLALGRGLCPGASNWDVAVRPPRGTRYRDPLARMSSREWKIWERHYRPWSRHEGKVVVGLGTRLQLVLEAVVDNVGLRAIEHTFELRHSTALGHLLAGLDEYAKVAGWVRRRGTGP